MMNVVNPLKPGDFVFMKHRTTVWALFVHSMSIIGFQIILMRILSVNQWDHFANMIIGIAMLGFGVSGSLLAVFREKITRQSTILIPLLMILSSVFMLAAYRLSQSELLKFDTFLVFSSVQHVFRLILFIFMYFLPFLAASLAIGIIYVENVSGIGKLYFSNLLGSGIGGITGLVILHFFMPHHALTVTAMFPAIAAVFLFTRKNRKILTAGFLILALLIIAGIVKPVPPAMSQYKSLAKTMKLPDAEVVMTVNGISSLVHIVTSDYLRYAPGLSLHFTGSVPVMPMAFVNGNAAGFIPEYDTEDADILNFSTYSLPYIIADPSIIAVISAGTGELTAHAISNGACEIDAFEPDINLVRAIYDLQQLGYKPVYAHETVSLHTIQARSFLQGRSKNYDLIVLPTVGSFGGTSGVQALKENYDLTIESLRIYWQNLMPDGMMTITVYTDFPPRSSLKVIYSLAAMLRQQGIDHVAKHIAAVRSWTAITFVVTKEELSRQQLENIRDFADNMGFDLFQLPDIQPGERDFFNDLSDENLFSLTDSIIDGNTMSAEEYMFYVTPATDNRPFFSRYLKINRMHTLMNEYPWRELPFLELGYIIVWLTFMIALLFSALFILLPVLRFRKSRGKLSVFFYFGSIGLGFMCAEIIFIQKFILYLGQPVYAVSAVLSIMLIASGAGSYFSGKLRPGSKIHMLSFAVISILLIFYALFLTGFLSTTAGAPVLVKMTVAVMIVGLPAFFMGFPFPLGLRSLSAKHHDKIAWAWGINGFFSVIATPLALIIAVEAGSFLVIALASFAYLTALTSIFIMSLKSDRFKVSK